MGQNLTPVVVEKIIQDKKVFYYLFFTFTPEIKTGDKMKESDTIGAIVAENARAALVFDRYNLDYCCGGGKTLDEACRQKGISVEAVIEELKELGKTAGTSAENVAEMKLDDLTRHIEKVHHRYTEDTMVLVRKNLERLEQVHGARHPELTAIHALFADMAGHLAVHMKKEELVLFPYIRKLVNTGKEAAGKAIFGSVASPIEAMMNDHAHEGERLAELAKLTDHYNAPPDGCNTYKATYAAMRELEADLHMHIHLENNVLFPRAIELENSFKEQTP